MLRGVLELVIDETGRVEDANMSVPANPRYDPLVLDAAKDWKYRPATLDGVPVKFRRSISLTLKPDAE
jgi:TonB family protein